MADQVPKKLSPMMQKKLAAEQAGAAPAAAPAAKAEPAEPKPAPAAAPAAPKAAPKAAPAAAAKPAPAAAAKPAPKAAPAIAATGDASRSMISAENKIPNPNGERYGYGDGLASVFGQPPAIDEAYFALKTVSGIPAAVIEGGIKFLKTVAGMK